MAINKSFRPLSRYIGLYPIEAEFTEIEQNEFPSPLEVYRFISKNIKHSTILLKQFPSPLEVYRFISRLEWIENNLENSFRPLSRYIGLYHGQKNV